MSEALLMERRGRPARGARPVGAELSAALVDLALGSDGAEASSTQTARLEAVIARGLEVEREIGALPPVKLARRRPGHDSGDRRKVKVYVPPDLWAQFSRPLPGMSITARLASLLYHGLGLHTDNPVVDVDEDQFPLLKTG